jgi:DNA-binding NarL/FixJ family response regulator
VGRIRVLVVDDHRIFAEALAAALAAEPDVDVVAAGSAPVAERILERAAAEGRAFHVLLVDADLGAAGPPHAGPPRRLRPSGAAADTGPGSADATRRGPVALPVPRRPGATASLPSPVAAAAAVAAVAPPGGQPIRRRGSTLRAPRPAGQPGLPAAAVGGAGLGSVPVAREAADDGIALVARCRAAHPDLRAVVLADADDARRAVRALQAGAGGWVAKESSLGRLMAVVRGVLRDETHLPPALLTGVVREFTAARRARTESERLIATLTPRERQVLRCMVAGLGRQAVADRLYLSPHTVRTHMQNVLGKLGVHSTLAAVALARRAGVGPAEIGTPFEAPIAPSGGGSY